MNRHNILRESFVTEKGELLEKIAQSICSLEEKLNEGEVKREICTAEWCIATKYALDDIAQTLYSISELRWVTEEDAQNINTLRHSISHLYAKYRDVLTKSRPAPADSRGDDRSSFPKRPRSTYGEQFRQEDPIKRNFNTSP